MQLPTSEDLRRALDALNEIGEATTNLRSFAEATVHAIPRVVSSDITIISYCDVPDRRAGEGSSRAVVHDPARDDAPHAEHVVSAGIDAVVAVPLHADDRHLVSVVLNRKGREFDAREMALLELLRGPLSAFYRLGVLLRDARIAASEDAREARAQADAASLAPGRLTPREEEVLAWLRAGKTNREIGEILGISARTVEKHLEHLLAKAGVENRTAAVLRLSR